LNQPPTHPHHLTAHFTKYAELDQPTHITTHTHPHTTSPTSHTTHTTHTTSHPTSHTTGHTTHITGHQNNQPIFTTTLTTHPTP
ncbi:hypothetical protein ACWGOA_35145, partial [Streptomyces sp. NPDC055813]